MLSELPEAYAALAAGRAPELSALETSYVDFAFWQRARLENDGALAPQARSWLLSLLLPASAFRPASCAPLPYVYKANAACLLCPTVRKEGQGCLGDGSR